MVPLTPCHIQGQVAIVTGGSSGIGRASCLALARKGASVVVVGKTPSRVFDAVAEVERAAHENCVLGLVLDVRHEEEMEEMSRRTLARFGRIDVLVASAGVGRASSSRDRLMPPPVAQMSSGEWDEVIDTNLKGVFSSNRAVLPTMIRQRRGWIINVSSSPGGLYGSPYAAAYCASKFGVLGFSESLSEEVSQFGVKVQVLLPDATDTPMLEDGGDGTVFGKTIPPGRVGDFVVHLLSMPEGTVLVNPLIAPLGNQSRPARYAGGGRPYA
jgi:NAD(P)-dependent dehydrogenase (short-subunit alcohol dehydrogenase family)